MHNSMGIFASILGFKFEKSKICPGFAKDIMFHTYTYLFCRGPLGNLKHIHSDMSHLYGNNRRGQDIFHMYFCILFHIFHCHMLENFANHFARVCILSFMAFWNIYNLKTIDVHCTYVLHIRFLSNLHYIQSHMIHWHGYNQHISHRTCFHSPVRKIPQSILQR